jgi:predicted tellurium resistance membrane protein TerC
LSRQRHQGKLPVQDQQRARTTGIALAVITRLLLLFSLSWIIRLENPLFSVAGLDFSGRDLILLAGGVFLIWKAT